MNARDITDRFRNIWIIDFGIERDEEKAKQYLQPYEYLRKHVYPERINNKRSTRAQYWWLFGEPVPKLRPILATFQRYIVTPRVAKHRLLTFVSTEYVPDSRLLVFTREDDYFFGVLHSKIHEVWSLATSSRHGVGNDPTYNNTTCFETFPFPWPPGAEDTSSAAYAAISATAKQLHEERDAWLNLPEGEVGVGSLDDRTLTNLYNALVALRSQGEARRDMPRNIKAAAWEFAPRLRDLHDALDAAVCDAYGWPHDVLDDEEEILRRLLALNLARAGGADHGGGGRG